MNPAEFSAALARLGVSGRAFAAFTGSHERSVRRWVAGDRDIPKWVPVMLGLMQTLPQVRAQQHSGLDNSKNMPHSPRSRAV